MIRRLVAYDEAARADVVIEPGTFIESCRIERNPHVNGDPAVEVYMIEFESGGRPLRCPLVSFQARTQTEAATVGEHAY